MPRENTPLRASATPVRSALPTARSRAACGPRTGQSASAATATSTASSSAAPEPAGPQRAGRGGEQRRVGAEQHGEPEDDDGRLPGDALQRDDPHAPADVADLPAVADGPVHVAEHARGEHGVEEHRPVAVGDRDRRAGAAGPARGPRCASATRWPRW